jgi:hypothetical protein
MKVLAESKLFTIRLNNSGYTSIFFLKLHHNSSGIFFKLVAMKNLKVQQGTFCTLTFLLVCLGYNCSFMIS